jgi:hypothetical protein
MTTTQPVATCTQERDSLEAASNSNVFRMQENLPDYAWTKRSHAVSYCVKTAEDLTPTALSSQIFRNIRLTRNNLQASFNQA